MARHFNFINQARDAVNICIALDLLYPTADQWYTYLGFSQFWTEEINADVSISDMLEYPDLFDSEEEFESFIDTLRRLG